MNVVIRPLKKKDIETVRQLLNELGYPLDKDKLLTNIDHVHQKNGIIFVAEINREVVGCLSAMVNVGLAEGLFGEILSLVVSEKHRGKGIGKILVEQAEEWLKPKTDRVRIRANTLRLDAHRFYKSLGYQEIKTQISFIKIWSETAR